MVNLLAGIALVVLPSLHGLKRLVRKKGGGDYLERSSSGNSLMAQGCVVALLNLVVGVLRLVESEHFDIREVELSRTLGD
jgi:hypothetical protein